MINGPVYINGTLYEGKVVLTQKDRWNDKAARYEALAAGLLAKAEALQARQGFESDRAFLTQPGRLPARDRMHARLDRAAEMAKRSSAYAEKAANLRSMAARNKGDAERARDLARSSLDLTIGAITDSIWGRRKVSKINAKTVRLEGVSCPVDKAHLRVVAG